MYADERISKAFESAILVLGNLRTRDRGFGAVAGFVLFHVSPLPGIQHELSCISVCLNLEDGPTERRPK